MDKDVRVKAYRHFLFEVHRGVLAEGFNDDSIRNRVQKDLCCICSRRLSLVDRDEGGENHVADCVTTLAGVRGEEQSTALRSSTVPPPVLGYVRA